MTDNLPQRETLATRLGFILLSAGCAIGLGNVWRFPFIVGQYGGGIFVFLYLFFLLVLGFPVLMTELAIGRGGRSNLVGAFRNLAARHTTVWVWLGRILIVGCLILMIYYTTVSGWLFSYAGDYMRGTLANCATPAQSGEFFNQLLASPGCSGGYMLLAVAIGTLICCFGVQEGVEKCAKYMMGALLILMIVLAGYALTTPGAREGLAFYLKPDWGNFIQNPLETIFAAMGQAFFTLSLGIGSMTIFGSYLNWKKSLAAECGWIIALDTFVALCSGLIIFPICKSYNVDVAQGPGLLFVSLPNAFSNMAFGRLWGALFFIFMSLAAITTIVAVFENLIAYLQDEHRMNRTRATLIVGVMVALLSLPCVFGYNVWKNCHPLGGDSTILDFEDFIVSQNLLPLGSLVLCLFAFAKQGWGKARFVTELEAGQKWSFPGIILFYWQYLLPLIILVIFATGYWQKFF